MSSDKKISIELTSRQWDHVQIAVEECTANMMSLAVNRSLDGLPAEGARKGTDRYEEIANEISIQLHDAQGDG